jgi:hypothetical protein
MIDANWFLYPRPNDQFARGWLFPQSQPQLSKSQPKLDHAQ